ncbi:MAG: cyclic 2,3-diphosphoglycerate synthase, partial [Anaerolineae bacterium]
VVIMGAAGRDFHNFNVYFRDNPNYEVVAFTATQIPNIAGRQYPPDLAGDLYPDGIPILPESELTGLIQRERIDQVVFSYSDVSHLYVMHEASRVLAAGADFRLLGPHHTMLKSRRHVVAVCAVRTGAGKSQTSRHVAGILRDLGHRVVVVRHPMPYGDLSAMAVQRFETYDDLARYDITIEEREEYEPHLAHGTVVYAGVDYERILRQAETEADVILWDGGNNDFPFFQPDLLITLVDPHRAGHEVLYYPGETTLRLADVVVINKMDTAPPDGINTVRQNIRQVSPSAIVVEAVSPISVDDPAPIRGARVLVVEDGPTLTHGGMKYGAGVVAARRYGAAEIIDPRPYAVGSIEETYEEYPETGPVLPAMGYSDQQIRELEETIHATPADQVLIATPIDLGRLIQLDKPAHRVRYELQVIGRPTLEEIIRERFEAL